MTEGILAGGSCGLRRRTPRSRSPREIDDPEAMVAVILPDGGRSLPVEDLQRRVDDASTASSSAPATATVGDVLRAQARGRRDPAARDRRRRTRRSATRSRCCTSTASPSCRSSAPHDPHAVVGSIGERGLLKHARRRPGAARRARSST